VQSARLQVILESVFGYQPMEFDIFYVYEVTATPCRRYLKSSAFCLLFMVNFDQTFRYQSLSFKPIG
jgi:hypothetical protein